MSTEEHLLAKFRKNPLPRHVAIIMDGNGRWAKKRGFPRIYGHRAGSETVRRMVEACGELGVEVLTLYAFSTENWRRPRLEVDALMKLLCMKLNSEAEELNKKGVRLQTIGRTRDLPESVQAELKKTIQKLEHNRGLILNLALNYGGRQEIVDAVNQILKSGVKKIDEEAFSEALYTRGLSDPDLLIRTSGEQRISNFLLYQTAYSEFYVTPVLWPDFKKEHLYEAIFAYQNRERRFGGTEKVLAHS